MGNTEETERLLARMRVKFPYYLYIQMDAARQLHTLGQRVQAWRFIHSLMSRGNYHGADLRAIMQLCVDLYMAEKRYNIVARHLKAWQSFEIEEDQLTPYIILDTINALDSLRRQAKKHEKKKVAKEVKRAGNPDATSKARMTSKAKATDQAKTTKKDGEDPSQLSLF